MDVGVRKGSWTVEEDNILFNYVHLHGEGRWNSVPVSAGLKRTGKSCRLRWLNYLNPRVRRGNITLQEQLLILQLHFRWGNSWSKIAQFLPGRTDNEIKNYWRTRVQKQAKHLNCDINSKQFRDSMRFVWIPRLIERIESLSESERIQSSSESPISFSNCSQRFSPPTTFSNCSDTAIADRQTPPPEQIENPFVFPNSHAPSPDSADQVRPISAPSPASEMEWSFIEDELETSLFNREFEKCSDPMDGLWNEDDLWFLQQQLYD